MSAGAEGGASRRKSSLRKGGEALRRDENVKVSGRPPGGRLKRGSV
ncbi:MAG: hypothetical protein LBR53_12340 [Deltaproteobacteria bacterium]|nr:hypothetical protein [Deltaproteobacteria bacterium]